MIESVAQNNMPIPYYLSRLRNRYSLSTIKTAYVSEKSTIEDVVQDRFNFDEKVK